MGADRSLMYCNFVICEGREWFWSMNFNALFYREINNHKVRKVGRFLKSKNSTYNNIILFDNKLIIMPCWAREIMIYDIGKNVFRFAEVKIPDLKENCNLFYGYAAAKEYLFLVGNQFPYVVKFNMKTEKIEKIINLFPEENREVYFREAVVDENELIIPVVDNALIFEVNIETMQWTGRKIGRSESGFSAVCKDENSIWLLPKDRGPVLQWYRENDKIVEHEIEKLGFQYTPLKPNFHSGIYLDDKVWIFPFYGNRVLSFDLKTKEMIKDNAINKYLDEIVTKQQRCKFRSVEVVSGCIYLLCCYKTGGELLIYVPEKDEMKICDEENLISNADYLEYLQEQNAFIIREGKFTVEDFIDFTISHLTEKVKKQKTDNYGLHIHKAINGDS